MKKKLILTASLLTLTTISLAQNTPSIVEQFNKLIKESTNYQTYKVVKKDNLELLQRNVSDSLDVLQNEIDTNNAEILKQKASVSSLTQELEKVQNDLSIAQQRENNLEVLGISTNKTTYQTLVWTIIAVLLSSLFVLFYRFKKSHVDTKEAIKKLHETENELEELRRLSLEREQKIRRQLQDEINKNKAEYAN